MVMSVGLDLIRRQTQKDFLLSLASIVLSTLFVPCRWGVKKGVTMKKTRVKLGQRSLPFLPPSFHSVSVSQLLFPPFFLESMNGQTSARDR